MTDRQRQDARHREVVRTYYQTGNESLLGPVLSELRPRLLALAYRSFGVGRRVQAEDLVQDALLDLVVGLRARKYDAEAASLFLFTGSHLRYLSLSNRKGRHSITEPGPDENPFAMLVEALTAEDLGELEQDVAASYVSAATEAVLQLDASTRAAVVLHYYQGLTPTQAAARLGLSEQQYQHRLDRGLLALRHWGEGRPLPTGEVYAALLRLDTGGLFQEPLRMAG